MSRENDWIYHFRDRKPGDTILPRLMTAILDADPRAVAITARAELKNLTVEPIPENIRVSTAGVGNLEASTDSETVEILHFDHLSLDSFHFHFLTRLLYNDFIPCQESLLIIFIPCYIRTYDRAG